MYYNGTLLDDGRLLFVTIVMTILLIVFIAALAVYFIFIRNFSTTSTKKESERIKRLEKDAKENSALKKQLDKLKRKRANRNKRVGNSIWLDVIVSVLASFCIFLNLFCCVIPGWTDYALKDYVVYTGSYESTYTSKSYYTILPDGTEITGGRFNEGSHHGTVIYSKRSLILIDIIE